MADSTAVGVATAELQTHRFRAMASPISVQLVSADPRAAAIAFDTVERIFREVEASCSRFDPTSPLMVANGSPLSWHVLPDSCFRAISEAHDAYQLSGGLFDPRVLRSLEAHGYDRSLPFARGDVRVLGAPDSARLARGRWRPKFDKSRLAVLLGPEAIDLGGIGKGLAVRWAMTAIQGVGSAALIEAGGDLAARGNGPERTGWRVAVEDPTAPAAAPQRQPVAVLNVSDRAVATSSIRLQNWRLNGRPAHHLIDPRTAHPAESGLLSVTVIHGDPSWAEVWSKSLFLLGASTIAAEALRRGLSAIWVDESGRVEVSPAAQSRILWRVSNVAS